MSNSAPSAIASYGPFDPRVPMADPYPAYHALRAEDPVFWHAPTKTWLVSSYEHVRAIMQDDATYGQAYEHREVSRNGEKVRDQPYFQLFSRMFFLLDGPDHQRIRPLFARWFMGPNRIKKLTPIVERVTKEVLDELEGVRKFDVVKDVGYKMPLNVISELLGVRQGDSAMIAQDVHDVVAILESVQKGPEVKAKADVAILRLRDYFADLVKDRRKNMGDDLLSSMIEDFDAGKLVDEQELLANTILMYLAGHETTTDSFSLSVLSLYRNPDKLAELRADPGLMRKAVEELLRYDGTAQGFSRAPNKDVIVGDKKIEAGTFMLLLLGAANRDPAAFPDPDKLDFARSSVLPVSFGGGAHVCIGNMLARLELSVGLSELLRRQPNLELDSIDPPLADFKPSLTRGMRRLIAHA